MSATRRAPSGLGTAGKAIWRQIWADLDKAGAELRPDEVATLTAACETADLVRRLESELAGAPLTVPGVRGAVVANPLLSELRQNRALQAQLLARLKLVAADQGPESPRTRSARRAAQARWSGSGSSGVGGRGA